jgi:hypothetical protein
VSNELYYLYDTTEETRTRYIGFTGAHTRYDLAVMTTEHFYGKKMVINLQNNRCAIIGNDDLNEEGYLEYAFGFSEEEAKDLLQFLEKVI